MCVCQYASVFFLCMFVYMCVSVCDLSLSVRASLCESVYVFVCVGMCLGVVVYLCVAVNFCT